MAKSQKVKVFFDMYGTLAEYNAEDKEKILSNQAGVYLTKRPLKSILMWQINLQKSITSKFV